MPVGGTTIYSAGKAYVTSMMECMRPEFEPRGVICSAFCPGAVQSNIAESGKTRPAELADTGYAEADKRRQASGSSKKNSVRPGSLVKSIRPLCACTMLRQMARPRPVPPF